jgi:hypothetical protein
MLKKKLLQKVQTIMTSCKNEIKKFDVTVDTNLCYHFSGIIFTLELL